MLKCNECGNIFDEPKMYRECVGEAWGQPAYQEFSYCPFCDSEDFDDYEEGDEE